jgi:hypothetical protein
MLYIFQNTDQTVAINGNIGFNTIGIQTGTTATRSQSNDTIFLNRPGFYSIDISTTGAPSAGAGDITVSMYVNGVQYNGATGSSSSTGLTDIVNIAFPAIVQVAPACGCVHVPITFVNEGVAAVFSNVVVRVTKIA